MLLEDSDADEAASLISKAIKDGRLRSLRGKLMSSSSLTNLVVSFLLLVGFTLQQKVNDIGTKARQSPDSIMLDLLFYFLFLKKSFHFR